jgi:hypothetical protein
MDSTQVQQGSEAWREARLGKVTASRIRSVMAKPKKKGEAESTTRRNYISQLALEIVTGKSKESQFQSWDMQRGIKLEPEARSEYELRVKEMVLTAGFYEHPTIPRFGASPDALVGEKGLAQFKCPIWAVHYEYRTAAKKGLVPAEYYPQVQCELAVMPNREWNDFVSYNEDYPENSQLIVIRAHRDEALIKDIESAVLAFNSEVDEMVADLSGEESSLESTLVASIAEVEKRHVR